MALQSRARYALFIGLLGAVCFGIVSVLTFNKGLRGFDSSIIERVQGLESETLTKFMKAVSYIGTTVPMVALSLLIMIFLYAVLKHRMELVLFVVAVLGAKIWNDTLKNVFERERPTLHRLVEEVGYSFPSGHSMVAFAFYGILAFLLWRHLKTRTARTILLFFAVAMTLLIGISRIYLGVHYPSDVIGGYMASACWLGIIIWLFQWYMERRSRR
ncbi:phosphatase PAP2 family protein [Paenibacillus sp. MBLB4367]|uniref:phosphatase PAP2 family protein n=1 Tax=Paenibacillus sp. MBLB4367 TaxID=3384767 RepID=UPI003908147D